MQFDPIIAGVPLLVAAVAAYGALRGVAVYDAFVEGAKKGLRTVFDILPSIAAAMLLIALLRASGVLDLLMRLLSMPMEALGLPKETLPLLVLRPVSGSASLATLEEIFRTSGADSLAGRVAAAMMGSTETVLYTIAIYLGAANLKKTRGILPVSLLSTLVGAIAAGVIVRLIYY